MDTLSKAKRSWVMSRIGSKDTAPERCVRSLLHSAGFRFRLHRTDLPGRPDLVLPGRRVAILVNGCFWHRHRGCPHASTPKTRRAFWQHKFRDNVARDRRVTRMLRDLGWTVLVVWECETANPSRLGRRLCTALR